MRPWIVFVVIGFAVAFALPAFAQKDKMSLGESFGAVILKPAAKQPAPQVTIPKDALALPEVMVPVRRPGIPAPPVPKAP